MNKRQKKKQLKRKQLHNSEILASLVKNLQQNINKEVISATDPLATSFVEQQCRLLEEAYKAAYEKAGFVVKDVTLIPNKETGIVNGFVSIIPSTFQFDITITKQEGNS